MGYESEMDLLQKTEGFYQNVSKKRLEGDLDNIKSWVSIHFKDRFGTEKNYYQESIEKNIEYLKDILYKCGEDYKRMLRRIGVISDN